MRTTRSLRAPALVLATVLVAAVPFLRSAPPSAAGAAGPAPERSVDSLVGPGGAEIVERHVADDMVVDWLEAPPAGADAWATAATSEPDAGGAGHDHAAHGPDAPHPGGAAGPAEGPTGSETVEDEAASPTAAAATSSPTAASSPGQGFAVFATSPRLLPGGYTIRLAGADARIEQYRDELAAAARAATAATGRSVRVAAGRGGATTPARGEIVAVLGQGPCGGGAIGCGGPTYTSTELVAGRVWITAAGLSIGAADRQNLAAHELGHALGLQHYSGAWSDGRQAMYPIVSGIPTYRSGDVAGLRFMAGAFDRAAGTVSSRSYAAGHVRVSGTLASGRRVRVSVGPTSRDVTAEGGRFWAAVPAGAGTHQVCVRSLDAGSGFRRDLGCAPVSAPGAPVGRYEEATGSFETIRVRGWALDPQTAEPVRVEVRRNGSLVATHTAGAARPDVATAHPHHGPSHGFDLQVPAVAGTNDVCVRILGVGAGGDKDLGCRRVVHHVDPTGAFELERTGRGGASIVGWAIDPNTAAAIDVEVTVDGRSLPVLGTTRASEDRPEVGRSHPAHGPAHGFSQRLTLPPGDHVVCVVARNVGLGSDRELGCVALHVDAGSAVGSVASQLTEPAVGGLEAVDAVVGGLVGDVATGVGGLLGG